MASLFLVSLTCQWWEAKLGEQIQSWLCLFVPTLRDKQTVWAQAGTCTVSTAARPVPKCPFLFMWKFVYSLKLGGESKRNGSKAERFWETASSGQKRKKVHFPEWPLNRLEWLPVNNTTSSLHPSSPAFVQSVIYRLQFLAFTDLLWIVAAAVCFSPQKKKKLHHIQPQGHRFAETQPSSLPLSQPECTNKHTAPVKVLFLSTRTDRAVTEMWYGALFSKKTLGVTICCLNADSPGFLLRLPQGWWTSKEPSAQAKTRKTT